MCKVARYHGPLVLELKPDIPGAPHASAERFKLGPACPAFAAAWQTRLSTADTDLLAADGSRQRVHRLVLQCRLPVLGGQPLATGNDQVCVCALACATKQCLRRRFTAAASAQQSWDLKCLHGRQHC